MSDPERCESCGGALPETGVLLGHCPRCLVELGLESESDFRESDMVLAAIADETRSMVGQQLGHYQVLALAGVGGMGAVWKAKDTRLDREVAIKTLPSEFNQHADRLARFEREAKLLAALNHPNIAAIHGFDEDRGLPFLVLELVGGDTLADRLRHGAISLEEALNFARQISGALEAAHDHGIIHRDLKPTNIKITDEGIVKVLDFGIAKAFEADDAHLALADSPLLNIESTQQGLMLGTAAYMAPEQADGKKVDLRADIWAFGVVLYEMVTGTRLFEGADSTETIASVKTKEPDFDLAPAPIRRLLKKCLEKDPKNRLRAIGDAWELLNNESMDSHSLHRQTGMRNATLAWILASVLAMAAIVFSFLWLKPKPPLPLPEVVRFQIQAPPGSRLPLGTPAISNDGRTIAYTVIDPDGKTRIHVRAIDGLETRALAGTEGASHPFWSPHGDSLVFGAAQKLKRIELAGGSVHDLMNTGAVWQGDWNRYDDILATKTKELFRISPQGGTPTPLPNSTGDEFPAFLSDGRRFLVRVANDQGSSIQLGALGSTERTLVVDNVVSAPVVAQTPRGKTYLLFLRESDLVVQEFDEASGKVRGNPALLVPHIGQVGAPAIRPTVGVSPSGILAFQSGDGGFTRRRLTWVDRSGLPVSALSPDVSLGRPDLSPDELSVAGGRDSDIWVTDLVRESSERKTFDDRGVPLAVWSDDGLRLAVHRQSGIYAIDIKGGGQTQLLTETPGMPTSWSGQHLLYNFKRKIYLIDLSNAKNPIQVGNPNGDCSEGMFSPDGKYIAFGSDTSGRSEVYLQPIPPGVGETRVSINGGLVPRWRGDGKEIFFVTLDGDLMAVDIKLGDSISVGTPHKLFRFESNDGYDVVRSGYDVSRNGQRFLVVPPLKDVNSPITVVLNWWVELENKMGR